MKHDFDKLTDRFNQNSLKWDVQKNELPMWVADMDFEVAPEIVNALRERLDKKYLDIILFLTNGIKLM